MLSRVQNGMGIGLCLVVLTVYQERHINQGNSKKWIQTGFSVSKAKKKLRWDENNIDGREDFAKKGAFKTWEMRSNPREVWDNRCAIRGIMFKSHEEKKILPHMRW